MVRAPRISWSGHFDHHPSGCIFMIWIGSSFVCWRFTWSANIGIGSVYWLCKPDTLLIWSGHKNKLQNQPDDLPIMIWTLYFWLKLVLRICVSLAPAQPGYFFIYLGGRNAITKIFERATTKILCRAKKRQKEQKTVCESRVRTHTLHILRQTP